METKTLETQRSSRRFEARSFFVAHFDALHCILTSLYRVGVAEATQLEGYLSDWFEMFAARPGNIQMPVTSLRVPLLIATCRVGCLSALSRQEEEPAQDERFKEFLRIDPEIVAQAVEEKLRLGLRPDSDLFPGAGL